MRNILLAGVATLALAAGSLTALSSARADDATLTAVTQDDLPAMIKGDKTVVVFVTGPNCGTCGATEALLAAKGNEKVKFVKFIDNDTTDGAIAIVSPSAGNIVFRAGGFHPTAADIDNVIADITTYATAEDALAAAKKPFKDQLDAVKAEFEAAAQPFRDQLTDLKAKADAAAKQFDDQIAALQDQEEAATSPFRDQFMGVQKDIAADATIADLRTQYAAAREAGDQDKMTAIEGKFAEAIKPYKDKQESIRAAAQAAAKPIEEKIQALSAQADAARKPFMDQVQQVREQAAAALDPIRQKGQKVSEDEAAATTDIGAKVESAEEALTALIEAETPAPADQDKN
jgi:hypothetical protein